MFDQASLMTTDNSGRDLFVSFVGGIYGYNGIAVYDTGRSVPEPSTFSIVAAIVSVLAIEALLQRRRNSIRMIST